MPPAAPADFDERAVRAAAGVLAVWLLAAFVFRRPVLVYVATAAEAIGAIAGPQSSPLHLAYRSLIGARLPPGQHRVASTAVRAQHVLAVALLALASLSFLIGIGLVGSLATLAEAGVAAVAATTGFNAATALRDRLDRH
jgi:hypothetical protein